VTSHDNLRVQRSAIEEDCVPGKPVHTRQSDKRVVDVCLRASRLHVIDSSPDHVHCAFEPTHRLNPQTLASACIILLCLIMRYLNNLEIFRVIVALLLTVRGISRSTDDAAAAALFFPVSKLHVDHNRYNQLNATILNSIIDASKRVGKPHIRPLQHLQDPGA
jgi:hypothetical protein